MNEGFRTTNTQGQSEPLAGGNTILTSQSGKQASKKFSGETGFDLRTIWVQRE